MNGSAMRLQSFTCYFCNKLIENETEKGHITTCGSVLEPCPNKCGSYVQRSMRGRHMHECQNRKVQTLPRLVKQQHLEHYEMPAVNSFNTPTQTDTYQRRNTPPAENQAYRNLHSDIMKFSNKVGMFEQALSQIHQNLNVVKNKQETLQLQQTSLIQSNSQLEKLVYQNQILMEWKKHIESQLDSIKHEVNRFNKSRSEYEQQWLNVDGKLMALQNMQADLNFQKESFLKEQLFNRETHNDLRMRLEKFEDFYAQENAAISALWSDHNANIKSIKEDCAASSKNVEAQKLKYNTLVFDIRTVTQISSENVEKLEIQEREFAEIKKSFAQIKLDMEILEEAQSSRGLIRPGNIIWKISDFSLKMDSAKINDVFFKSPIFYTQEYGYKVRLLVYLNGIKKWKGRHMIACLHVLKGEYDLMLKWPCSIEGNVILRDIQDHDNPRDFSKYITAKRQNGDEENEEPQESSSQYIFVPHTVLLKPNYVKDDTMFLEIKISQARRSTDETSL